MRRTLHVRHVEGDYELHFYNEDGDSILLYKDKRIEADRNTLPPYKDRMNNKAFRLSIPLYAEVIPTFDCKDCDRRELTTYPLKEETRQALGLTESYQKIQWCWDCLNKRLGESLTWYNFEECAINNEGVLHDFRLWWDCVIRT